jgi:hypothetical protein
MPLVLFAWLSDQAYFKELTDINTLSRLREKSEIELMEELTPFGFTDFGGEPETNELGMIPVDTDWLGWD